MPETVNTASSGQPQLHPDMVIAGILSRVKRYRFTGDAKRIHETFHELKKSFPELLGMFGFASGPAHIFSRALERSLARLQLSRIIGMENPDFETYLIKNAAKSYLSEVFMRFGPTEQEVLEKMARIFDEKCGIEDR